jgi:hypothetical protein
VISAKNRLILRHHIILSQYFQSSILVHLGVLANYVNRPDTTASGVSAVQRFLASILKFPAFDLNVTNVQFDEKIAEHTAQVLDAMLGRNLRELPGNATHSRSELARFLSEFARRLPTPYTLESATGGLQMRSQHWIAGADSFPTPMSNRCYVHLPKGLRSQIVNLVCMRNNTIYDVPDSPTNTDVPALLIESQVYSNKSAANPANLVLFRTHKNRVFTIIAFLLNFLLNLRHSDSNIFKCIFTLRIQTTNSDCQSELKL